MGKIEFVVFEITLLYPPLLVVSLFGRGGFGLWFAPSLVEVEVVVWSLFGRGCGCGLLPLV